MAGSSTIGRLNVVLTGSAKELESVITGAEKRLAGFAAKASAPFSVMASAMKGVPAMLATSWATFSNPIDDVVKSFGALLEFTPGGKMKALQMGLTDGLSGIDDSAKRGVESLKYLRKEASRYGVTPEFFKGLEFMAGPDKDVVPDVLDKINDGMARLRQDPAARNALRPFIADIDELAKKNPAEFFAGVSDEVAKLDNRVAQLDLVGRVTSNKLADKAIGLFGGSGQLRDALAATAGIYDRDLEPALAEGARYRRLLDVERQKRDTLNASYDLAGQMLESAGNEGRIRGADYYLKSAGLWFEKTVAGGNTMSKQLIDRLTTGTEKEDWIQREQRLKNLLKPAIDPMMAGKVVPVTSALEKTAADLAGSLEDQTIGLKNAGVEMTLNALAAQKLTTAYDRLSSAAMEFSAVNADKFMEGQRKAQADFGLRPAEIAAREAEKWGQAGKAAGIRELDRAFVGQQLAESVKSPWQQYKDDMAKLMAGGGSADDKALKAAQGLSRFAGPGMAETFFPQNTQLIRAGSQDQFALIDRIVAEAQMSRAVKNGDFARMMDQSDAEYNAQSIQIGQAILGHLRVIAQQQAVGRGAGLQGGG